MEVLEPCGEEDEDDDVHALIPIPIYNLALMRSLDTKPSALAQFKQRLWNPLKEMCGHVALLQFIQSENFAEKFGDG